ncbi:MAG: hypothetical protein SGBAC_009361 [Bacillariaceae sp.]
MNQKIVCFLALLAAGTQCVASFIPQQHHVAFDAFQRTRLIHQRQQPSVSQNLSQKVVGSIPRGGSTLDLSASSIIPTIVSSLQSGPTGILALSAITWSVVLPLTLYKKIYGIGVAYGFSVAAAGLAMLNVLATSSSSQSAVLLAKACIFYGARLGSYLLLRDYLRDYQTTIKNGSITSRITFSASLAWFYAFLTTPVLYALRSTGAVNSRISMAGASLAWTGAILEAVADLHKLIAKQQSDDKDGKEFTGPDTWAYSICRHPNYLGEMLFWVGLFVGGVGSFGKSIPAWLGSSFGLAGILSIMLKAASGLEKRQSEKYGGQERYDTWKSKAKYALIPFIQ